MDYSNTYNGWKNYETWCVWVWLTNEQGDYDSAIEKATEADDPLDLADQLKDEYLDYATELVGTCGVFSDLLCGSIREVDWETIATHLWEDVRDNGEEE